jgi:hypothetical protein
MKLAKVSLAMLCLIALIGGALAFKANRQYHAFYFYTTTLNAGNVTGACLIQTLLPYETAIFGAAPITLSDRTTVGVTTCLVRVVPSA